MKELIHLLNSVRINYSHQNANLSYGFLKTHFSTKRLTVYIPIMEFPQINKSEYSKLLIQMAHFILPRKRSKSSLMMSSKYLSKFSRKPWF